MSYIFAIVKDPNNVVYRVAFHIPSDNLMFIINNEEFIQYNAYTRLYKVNDVIKEFYKRLRYYYHIKYMIRDTDYLVIVDEDIFLKPSRSYDMDIPF